MKVTRQLCKEGWDASYAGEYVDFVEAVLDGKETKGKSLFLVFSPPRPLSSAKHIAIPIKRSVSTMAAHDSRFCLSART